MLLPIADLIRAGLAVGAVVAAVSGDGRGAALLAAVAVAAAIARLALLPRVFDLTLCVAFAVQGLGEALGLYDAWAAFDSVVHVVVPALTAPVAYLALARLEVVRDLRDPAGDLRGRGDAGVFVVTLALGLALGAVWELCEAMSDGIGGSSLQESVGDTNRDLLADAVGAMLGAAGLVAFNRHGSGAVKRVPGSEREIVDA